jgi:hypothetical protein
MRLDGIRAAAEFASNEDMLCIEMVSNASYFCQKSEIIYPEEDPADLIILHTQDGTVYVDLDKIQAVRIVTREHSSARGSRIN